MKLLQAIAGAKNGGAEEFFVRLSLAFERSRIEQRIVMRGHQCRQRRLNEGGVKTDTVPFRRWFDIKTGYKLKRAIKSFEPDIILTWIWMKMMLILR